MTLLDKPLRIGFLVAVGGFCVEMGHDALWHWIATLTGWDWQTDHLIENFFFSLLWGTVGYWMAVAHIRVLRRRSKIIMELNDRLRNILQKITLSTSAHIVGWEQVVASAVIEMVAAITKISDDIEHMNKLTKS